MRCGQALIVGIDIGLIPYRTLIGAIYVVRSSVGCSIGRVGRRIHCVGGIGENIGAVIDSVA